MRPRQLTMTETDDAVLMVMPRLEIELSKKNGKISRLRMHTGIEWKELVPEGSFAGDSWDLPIDKFEVVSPDPRCIRIDVFRANDYWEFINHYEIYPAGYIVCTFSIEARADEAVPQHLCIDIPLSESAVFAHDYTQINYINDPEDRRSFRAFGIDFSADSRPVTGSINLLVEQVMRGMQGRPQTKEIVEGVDFRTLKWNLSDKNGNPVPAGYRYQNRWGLSVTSIDNEANPVRGQRIYHWYGRYPRFPADDIIEEMAEYGCSILIIHMPSFSYITGSVPADPAEMKRVVDKAHSYGIKVLPYCVPQLVSIEAPYHDKYKKSRTENLRVWHSMKDTQIVFYETDTSFDCDELCIRSPDTYEFMYASVLQCVETYGLDGIYVDFAWPVAGICNEPGHDHDSGVYNFYDYWRILRDWRESLGDEAIMIGHGGGLLVSSDFVEAFDGCLTGEAQRELEPRAVGQQIGTAPTLWTMHRRKQDVFRSARTVTQLVRESITPHTGLGATGTSILASLDPAHFRDLLPLWQIWRAYPVERARVYTYLQPGAVEVDNDEVYYSLYATDDPYYLLILANAGGPFHDANPAVGVTARINIEGIPDDLRTWRLKGRSYETFRVAEIGRTKGALIEVPELLLYETVGYILSPGDPPETLTRLQSHLDGRWDRMGGILKNKAARNAWLDEQFDKWARLPQAKNRPDYRRFIGNRVAE